MNGRGRGRGEEERRGVQLGAGDGEVSDDGDSLLMQWVRADWRRMFPQEFAVDGRPTGEHTYRVLGAMARDKAAEGRDVIVKRTRPVRPLVEQGAPTTTTTAGSSLGVSTSKRRRKRARGRGKGVGGGQVVREESEHSSASEALPVTTTTKRIRVTKLDKRRRNQVPLARPDIDQGQAEEIVQAYFDKDKGRRSKRKKAREEEDA